MKQCKYQKSSCEKLYDSTTVVMDKNFINRYNPDIFCPKYGFCKNPRIITENIIDYSRKILKDKPPRIYSNSLSLSPYKFLAFSDVHVDLNYSEVSL